MVDLTRDQAGRHRGPVARPGSGKVWEGLRRRAHPNPATCFGIVRFTRERLRGLYGASQLVAGTAVPGTTEDPDLVRLIDRFRDCVAASVTRSQRTGHRG